MKWHITVSTNRMAIFIISSNVVYILLNSFPLSIDHIHPFDGNFLPYMFPNVDFAGKVFIHFFTILKLHNKNGALQIARIIQQTTSTDEVLFQSFHTFKVTRTDFHSLFKHSFAIVSCYNKLHNDWFYYSLFINIHKIGTTPSTSYHHPSPTRGAS